MARSRRPPELAWQALAIRERFGGTARLRRGHLTWLGQLTPTPNSPTYDVRVLYCAGRHPQVFVQEPSLVPNKNGWLPHMYSDTGSLCLYDPESDEWSPRDWLVETVIPWTAEWLLFYELWRFTDVWHGSGDDMVWANDPANRLTSRV